MIQNQRMLMQRANQRLAADLKNAERRRQRLFDKAKGLNKADLQAIIGMKVAAEKAKANAKAKAAKAKAKAAAANAAAKAKAKAKAAASAGDGDAHDDADMDEGEEE